MADVLTANFTKRFPSGAVIHGELNQPAHDRAITVLFGPSGCGKTTVLRCLAGLETPGEGVIQFNSEPWFNARRKICLTPQQRGIGFLFQDYALFPHLDVAGNIAFGLRMESPAARKKVIGEFIERFDLHGIERRRPRELSSGQQQRVALARALAPRPRLLLLDEPLSALDATLRDELRGELRRLLSACEIPVLLVTHDRAEAMALGDTIVVMAAGKVHQSGPVLDVFNHPADADVAKIVGMETLQPGVITGVSEGLATVVMGRARLTALAPIPAAQNVFVCIRGEDVILQRDGGEVTSSVRNRLAARVVALRHEGALVRVELDAGFPLHALVTRPACAELALQAGESITALIKAPAIHLVPR